jgi:hypothetical protein
MMTPTFGSTPLCIFLLIKPAMAAGGICMKHPSRISGRFNVSVASVMVWMGFYCDIFPIQNGRGERKRRKFQYNIFGRGVTSEAL